MRLIQKKDLPELRKKFLECQDPVGYKFAEKHLGGYEFLEKLLKTNWFKPHWTTWQEQLRAEIKSKALERIQEIAVEGSAQSLNAAKYLANGEYIDGIKTPGRGRPTKEEVSGELKRQVKALDVKQEDYSRMTALTLIQGGKTAQKEGK